MLKSLAIDVEKFKVCLEENKYAVKELQRICKSGRTSGVTGTPSFLLGKVNDKGEVEGTILRGAQPYSAFRTAIEAMLKK